MNFDGELEKRKKRVEAVLTAYLPETAGRQSMVLDAMRYAVSAGGKRLRPILMAESAALFTEEKEVWREENAAPAKTLAGGALPPFMAAIEFIHTYSLIHDDLPALDNDDYRRGRKTTHVVYGEDIAVIAGDGLLNLAFETALRGFGKAVTMEDYQRVECAMNILGRKAGVYGMIGGQCADLVAERPENPPTEETLLYIHKNKTAALIQAAMTIGAVLAGADEGAAVQLEKCAENIGVAFQIQDDILDVISSTEVLGKPVGSDEKNHKLTYVAMHGLEESGKQVKTLSEEALAILRSFPRGSEFLETLVERLIYREK
ncbi:MAG: polyprenyl synthetase family protein [Bacteroidales bacterium]|nr:polyprenyl synthetase family protein [Bacteroidales bacterium]MCM1415493.1 polyprenyl synthetase family protein [bacterium]MCM1423430.1 polyprenyl synthetase family protein [bacterium]